MNIRLRLTLTYLLVGLAAIVSVLIFMRLDNQRQVRQYMVRGGMVADRISSDNNQDIAWLQDHSTRPK